MDLLTVRTILEDVEKMNKAIVEYKEKECEKKEQLSNLEKEREAKYQELEAIKVFGCAYCLFHCLFHCLSLWIMCRRKSSLWKKRSTHAIPPSRLYKTKQSKSKRLLTVFMHMMVDDGNF